MSESVSFQSLEQLQQAISNLTGPQLVKLGERAGLKIANEIKDRLQKKPGAPSHPIRWTSAKQRAWYFWHRRNKGLPLEYTRNSDPESQKSSMVWAIRAVKGGAILGNPATYSPYVYSDQFQQPMHQATGWVTDKQAADAVMQGNEVGRIIQAEVHSLVQEAFRGFR